MDGVEYFVAWVALVFVCADGHVLWRVRSARDAGDDPSAAGRRALAKALRVAGAGVAGFILAIGIAVVALIVAVFEWFANGGRWGGWRSTLLVLASIVVLVALPVGVAVAQRRRNR